MKKSFPKLFAAILMCVILLSGCNKEGDPGPQGPKGEPGIEGAEGPEGPQGDPGTVNVIYSEWQSLDFSEVSPGFWEAEWSGISALTEATAQSSIVKMYFRPTEYEYIYALPYLDDGQIMFVYRVTPGSIFLRSDFPMDSYETDTWFRYVIVPAEISARVRANDFADYATVKRTYDLPD